MKLGILYVYDGEYIVAIDTYGRKRTKWFISHYFKGSTWKITLKQSTLYSGKIRPQIWEQRGHMQITDKSEIFANVADIVRNPSWHISVE